MSHLRTKYLAKLTRFTVYIEDDYLKPKCPDGNLTCWWIGRSTKLQTCVFEQGNRASISMRMSVACSGGNPQRFSWHILVDCAFFDNHLARVWWLIVHVLYLVKWQLVVCLFFELVCCVCLFVCFMTKMSVARMFFVWPNGGLANYTLADHRLSPRISLPPFWSSSIQSFQREREKTPEGFLNYADLLNLLKRRDRKKLWEF